MALDGAPPDEIRLCLMRYLARYADKYNNAKIDSIYLKLKDIRLKQVGRRLRDSQLKLKDRLIVGGSSKHAVLYDVQQNEEGRGTLTVHNSGEGAYQKGNKQAALVFKNLTTAQLNPVFFLELDRMIGERSNYMIILGYLQKQLGSPFSGRKLHKIQEHGSCAYKCYSSYFSEVMEPWDRRRFKVFLTESLIQECSALPDNSPLPVSKETVQEMLKEAEEVLAKRKLKARI